jgi:nucleoside-diphosphate-sugar epimerase
MYKDFSVIITGTNGFLGERLANHLNKDFRVVKIGLEGEDALKLDLIKESSWDKLDKYIGLSPLVLVHLAFAFSDENMERDNMIMLDNLCKFMTKHQNIFLIYPSTALVYGLKYNKLISEDNVPRPQSLYAKTKLNIEDRLMRSFPSRSTIFRLSNIYGAGMHKNTVIWKIINCIKQNKLIQLKDYNSIRDFIHIDNVVEVFAWMINYIKKFESPPQNKKLNSPYSVFNLSTGKGVSIYELAYKIAGFYNKLELLQEKGKVIHKGNNQRLVLSADKLKKFMGVGYDLKQLDIETALKDD